MTDDRTLFVRTLSYVYIEFAGVICLQVAWQCQTNRMSTLWEQKLLQKSRKKRRKDEAVCVCLSVRVCAG